jgi:hypothetical protein
LFSLPVELLSDAYANNAANRAEIAAKNQTIAALQEKCDVWQEKCDVWQKKYAFLLLEQDQLGDDAPFDASQSAIQGGSSDSADSDLYTKAVAETKKLFDFVRGVVAAETSSTSILAEEGDEAGDSMETHEAQAELTKAHTVVFELLLRVGKRVGTGYVKGDGVRAALDPIFIQKLCEKARNAQRTLVAAPSEVQTSKAKGAWFKKRLRWKTSTGN